MKILIRLLRKWNACEEAVEWCKSYDSAEKAWAECERGDWMLWLLAKLSGKPESKSRKKLVLVVCQCARLALPFVKKGELRPLKAIEMTEAWARSERGVTLEDVRKAAAYADAYAYAYAVYADAAAYAAAAAAYAATADVTRETTLKKCADIVRVSYKKIPFLRGG